MSDGVQGSCYWLSEGICLVIGTKTCPDSVPGYGGNIASPLGQWWWVGTLSNDPLDGKCGLAGGMLPSTWIKGLRVRIPVASQKLFNNLHCNFDQTPLFLLWFDLPGWEMGAAAALQFHRTELGQQLFAEAFELCHSAAFVVHRVIGKGTSQGLLVRSPAQDSCLSFLVFLR